MSASGDWALTIRHGSEVERERYRALDEVIAALEGHCERIRAEGGLEPIKAFREYERGDRIHARLEISIGGLLRTKTAGIDLMGDGRLVPYRGAVRRRELDAEAAGSPFEAVRRTLDAGPPRR